MPSCVSAQCASASTRGEEFKEALAWVCGASDNFLRLLPDPEGAQVLESGQGCTNDPLSSAVNLLKPSYV